MRATLGAMALGLVACGGGQAGPALSYGENARREYENGLHAYEGHDCITATPIFQRVRREYPYSRYAALAELRSADCELDQQHYTEAVRIYRGFIRARPTHPELDYAQYRVADSYYRQIPQDFLLSPPREERDQASTRTALRNIQRFLRENPDSERIDEVRRMERDVLALLARHELYVAGFYLQRDKPHASIARLETLLAEYAGSGLEPEALLLMGRTYLHMREPGRARRSFDDLVARFAETGFAEQGRRYLVEMGDDGRDASDDDAPAPVRGTIDLSAEPEPELPPETREPEPARPPPPSM